MKITISRNDLQYAAQLAAGAVAARSVNPVLSNIKLSTMDDGLNVTATDLEITLKRWLPGHVLRPGSCLLPPDRLTAILRESECESITITADHDETTIQADGKFRLRNSDVDQFPDAPQIDTHLPVPATVFTQHLQRVAFAADKRENARYNVTGVQFDLAAGIVAATDTKRLAVDQFTPVEGAGPAVVLPIKTVLLIGKLGIVDPTIGLTPQAFQLTCGRTTLHSGLNSGKFPPWREIFPKKYGHEVRLPVEQFASALRQASVMIDAESKRVDFEFEPGKLTMTAQGAEIGQSTVTMLGDWNCSLKIAFDPTYILSYLRGLDCTEVQLQLTDPMKPAVFVAGDYRYLVMPMGGN